MAPTKKDGKNKGCSAINKAVIREYTINIHRGTCIVDFKKAAPQAIKEIGKFAIRRGEVQIYTLTRGLRKPSGSKEQAVSHTVCGCSCPEKRNEDEHSPNKYYTLVTYVPVTTFKNVQTVNVEEN